MRHQIGAIAHSVQRRVLARRLNETVQDGPFKGLVLDRSGSSWGHLTPYLVGSYEEELHAVIERAIADAYDTILDVGCAEGYYAVGMARRLPSSDVVAFDTDPTAQALCKANADRNGVSVDVRGECTPESLESAISGATLIISDCEGYEKDLLDPSKAPRLAECDLLVEVHDFIDPTIGSSLQQRFAATHQIEVVQAQQRDTARYRVLRGLRPKMKATAVGEGRPALPHPMEWLVLRRK